MRASRALLYSTFLSGNKAPCPLCVSLQGGSPPSLATVASEKMAPESSRQVTSSSARRRGADATRWKTERPLLPLPRHVQAASLRDCVAKFAASFDAPAGDMTELEAFAAKRLYGSTAVAVAAVRLEIQQQQKKRKESGLNTWQIYNHLWQKFNFFYPILAIMFTNVFLYIVHWHDFMCLGFFFCTDKNLNTFLSTFTHPHVIISHVIVLALFWYNF